MSNSVDNSANKMKFVVIGLDDNIEQDFTKEIINLVSAHKVFSGGKRHHEIVQRILPEGSVWIDITVPLDDVFQKYTDYSEIVVFASGDPLFFGFANTIKRKLPEASIQLFPAFNSLQTLAHRLVIPYHDMRIVSLTGRPWHEFDKALIERSPKIGLLTDRKHTPITIAQRMIDYGYLNYKMVVGERLGNKELERVRTFDLGDVSSAEFVHPNNIILLPTEQRYDKRDKVFGIPDEEFHLLNGRAKMITKSPIRLMSLSALELQNKQSFWDVGFCTGSVSVEAKLQFPDLKVTSFEIREEGRSLMDLNAKKFGALGINTLIGDFLEADLSDLPLPDAVFIGGHGGKLKEMIRKISDLLQPKGIIVFNSVSEKSKQMFLEGAKEAKLTLLPEVRVSIDEFNPISILRAVL